MKKATRKVMRISFQIAILYIFVLIGDTFASLFHLKIPGDIIGLLLLLLSLYLKIVKIEWVEAGANWLLAELLLFFVPSAVGIVQYKELMENIGVQILLLIVVSTWIVMMCTGLFAEFLYRNRRGKHP